MSLGLGEIEALGDVEGARGLTIADVECLLLSYEYPADQVQRWSGGILPGVTLAVVRVTTSDGLVGHGETYAGNFAPLAVRELVSVFRPWLIGRDPSRIWELWSECYSKMLFWGRSGIAVSTLGAVESALWDLVGKAVGRPVVDLLGGPCRATLPRYASGGMEASPDALANEQRLAAELGFRATKIRGGHGAAEDAALVAIAREALPDELGLALDAVQGSNPEPWSTEEALAAGKAIEEFSLLWLEEPCSADNLDGYVACRKQLDTPIAGGEVCTSIHEFNRFFERGALDIVQPDAAHAGGVLALRRIGALAARHGVRMAVHSWLGGGSIMANYHAGFASETCDWLEFPTQPNPFVEELLQEKLRVEDGFVHAPTAPGLGIDVTDETVERYPFRQGMHYMFQARRQVSHRAPTSAGA